ncbi:MAG: carboxylating nicotinate-nucleotide diphosphorylase [Burkholderiales bacterium]|nr:carboxylating nicotinate-nucleotide diphosphorylase [Burkholderiales bacterium]
MIPLPPSHLIAQQVANALAEDIGRADWTAMLIPADKQANASILSRQAAVICGTAWVETCFQQVDTAVAIRWHVQDGQKVEPNTLLCEISGPARALLTAERCALNFLQSLSAVATETQRYVNAVAGTRAKIYDTRKTLPGLRLAQKYAVRVGGGENQRIGLYDGILIKENHIAAAGGIAAVMEAAIALAPSDVSIQIEVENLAELEEALQAGAKSVLLDNMSLADMREAVARSAGRAVLEASGGVDLKTVHAIAETGVDRISIGKLTKDIQALDLSMRLQLCD